MDVDIFKEVLVPVIGGLGIFMLGLEFMANGIQALAVNKMRAFRGCPERRSRVSPPARSSPGSFNRALP